jgi:3-dehydroquinate synthetase
MACGTTGFPHASIGRIEALIEALGLPVRVPVEYEDDAIVSAMAYDKKARSGQVHYALPLRIGRMPALPQLTRVVDETVLREALNATR